MNNNGKIVYIGNGNNYTRSFMRFKALKSLGYDILDKTFLPVTKTGLIGKPKILTRILHRLRLHRDEVGVNKWLLSTIRQRKDINIVWIDGATNIYPWVLSKLKKINGSLSLIYLSEDDILAKHNMSYWHRFSLRCYDHIFTTKQFNISELYSIGARSVHLISDSYCRDIHHPCDLTSAESVLYAADVSAVGAYEEDRYTRLLYIAKHGIKVNIWGGGWGHCVDAHHNLNVKNLFLYGEDYSKVISKSKINLNFLRKMNRDTITSRSIEIPACKGFMLSERTERQKEVFIEGVEADYFSSNEELLEKIRFYLANSRLRNEIASNGFSKCISGGFSVKDIVLSVVEKASSVESQV